MTPHVRVDGTEGVVQQVDVGGCVCGPGQGNAVLLTACGGGGVTEKGALSRGRESWVGRDLASPSLPPGGAADYRKVEEEGRGLGV